MIITMGSEVEETIIHELQEIKKELHYIRSHMIDVDTFLTPEEEQSVEEAISDFENGETISFDQMKKRR